MRPKVLTQEVVTLRFPIMCSVNGLWKEHLNYQYSRHFFPLKLFTKYTHVHMKFYKFTRNSLESCLKIMMVYWFSYIFTFKLIGSWVGIFGTAFFIIILGKEKRGRFLTFYSKIMGKGGVKKPKEVEVIYT